MCDLAETEPSGLKVWRCSGGVGGCGEKWPSVPSSFVSMVGAVNSHLTEGVSWGCGFMETGLLLDTTDLEFAELF